MTGKHAECRYKANPSDAVIVFIHGIQGSPLQFDYLIEALGGAYSYENLLLPGHGKTAKEFYNSSMAQWQDYVDERVRRLQGEYNSIILVGHSMGCLLAAQAAVSYPRHVRGLFLVAMPLCIHISMPYLRNNLLAAFGKDVKNEIVAAARKGNSVSVSSPFAYLKVIPRYRELLRKIKTARALITSLKQPTVVVQAEHDEIVSGKSLRYIKKQGNIRIVTAENSYHYFFSREAKERIANTLKDFIIAVTKTDL